VLPDMAHTMVVMLTTSKNILWLKMVTYIYIYTHTSVQTPMTSILPICIGFTNRHGSMTSSYKIKTITILGFSTFIVSWILQTSPSGSSNGRTTMVVMLTTSKNILWLKMIIYIYITSTWDSYILLLDFSVTQTYSNSLYILTPGYYLTFLASYKILMPI